jgi:hypothetical protein
MNDTDRAFYELAMAEAETFVAAGNFVAPLPVSEVDLAKLNQAWADPTFFHAAQAESVTVGSKAVQPALDPNRKLLPSRSELEQLPRLARVAFAARCARRVAPAFKRTRRILSGDWESLDQAIQIVETLTTADVAYSYAARAADATNATNATNTTNATNAAYASAVAAYATATADTMPTAAVYAARAADAALSCLQKLITVGTIGHLTSVARDFDRLQHLAKEEKWTDDTPVPPSVFGPMWDGPPPEWWTDDLPADSVELPSRNRGERQVASGLVWSDRIAD